MPFVNLALAYDANNVYVDAARNEIAFCDAARTRNQCATGNGLESLGTGNSLYNAVAALLDAESARAAFDALSGEIYASTRSALIDDSLFVRDAASDRVRAAFAGIAASSAPVMAYGEGGFAAARPTRIASPCGCAASAHGASGMAMATPPRLIVRSAAFSSEPTAS
jgi:uncharacterized protein with beta-barrel porin domain